jgi:hypothetical protein
VAVVATKAKRRRGRPRVHPISPTEFGRWVDARALKTADVLRIFSETAAEMGLEVELRKTAYYDLRNGQYSPAIPTMKVLKRMTSGAISVDEW